VGGGGKGGGGVYKSFARAGAPQKDGRLESQPFHRKKRKKKTIAPRHAGVAGKEHNRGKWRQTARLE